MLALLLSLGLASAAVDTSDAGDSPLSVSQDADGHVTIVGDDGPDHLLIMESADGSEHYVWDITTELDEGAYAEFVITGATSFRVDVAAGDDQVYGGYWDYDLDQVSVDLEIDLGAGDDVARGGLGDDLIRGQSGHDAIDGAAGDDVIRGNNGDDVLEGGEGADVVVGGNGSDALYNCTIDESSDGDVDELAGYRQGKSSNGSDDVDSFDAESGDVIK